uniref:Erythroblast membrane associated protein (Scianna blood group) n=1 Tax=Neovison vison TaxID=452646 RepID=A0A8C7BDA8_NEOVI
TEMASSSGSWLSSCLVALMFLRLPLPLSGDADDYLLAPLGGTAELPCPIPLWPVTMPTVVTWLRSPSPDRSQVVHVFRDGRDREEGVMPEYKGRTALRRDPREGSVSLEIRHVRLEDRGLYQCEVQIGNLTRDGIVTLQVAAPSPGRISSSTVALAVILPVLGILIIVGIYLIWKQRRSKENLLSDHAKEKGNYIYRIKSRGQITKNIFFPLLHELAVTLDPDTAHPKLILSEDRRRVKLGERRQPVPDGPQRFDFVVSVLGAEYFTAGCHYWEVDVGDKTKWALGVCSESVSRKGKITATPANGHWLVRQSSEKEYEALTSPQTMLRLKEPPKCVGIFLDYEAGIISFYNVTSRSHIFTFTHTFSGPLRPFFEPCLHDGGKNTAPLIICSELQKSEPPTVRKPEEKGHANGDVTMNVNPSLFPPQALEIFPPRDMILPWPSDLAPALQGLKVPSF